MPTIKQKKAYSNLVGNGGNVTQAMKDANYSLNTVHSPSKLTKSKGFQELLEKGVKDKHLIKTLKEGLLATKLVQRNNVSSKKIETIEFPDYATRHKYFETGLRLKGLTNVEQAPQVLNNIAVFIKEREQEPLHLEVDT